MIENERLREKTEIDELEMGLDSAENEETNTDYETNSCLWSNDLTLLFLTVYENYEQLISKGKITQKVAWEKKAQDINKKGYNIRSKQCSTKMTSLKRKYKQVKDYNQKSGNNRKTWKFYNLVDNIFGKKAWASPLATLSSTDDVDEGFNNVTTSEKITSPPSTQPEKGSRKRKSESILDNYLMKREISKKEERLEKKKMH
ncbi:uncharacterized protein [Prorops nasuta]|uniref:uncharacterized protein n=1 Tax=Prorops nasuta TaxID=863751 RepID=UPI0034CD3BF9